MCGEVVAAPLSLQDTVYPILRKKSLHFCENSRKFLKLCTAVRKKYKMKRLRKKTCSDGYPFSLAALASSPKGAPFEVEVKFPAKPQSLRAQLLPPGGAVAQRLRGYEWRSEKSVKAIAPTGAALAFLCFDFFFRIVKGVQPLTTGCGTQHPLRALGGTRVLLAAAPTTAPCFRRWRRSQLLRCGVGGVQR